MTDKAKAAALSPADELATLYPGDVRVIVREPRDPNDPRRVRNMVDVEVRALTLPEVSAMIAKLVPLVEQYETGASPMQLVTTHLDVVLDLVAQATGKDLAWLRALDAGDTLRVGVATLEANGNFLRVVADLLIGATGARLRNMLGLGPTAPSSSPNTDSATS